MGLIVSFKQRLPTKIIFKAQSGDKFALTHIYNEYKSAIYSLAYRILQDRDASEDVLQQVIEKVILKVSDLNDVNKFNGWLKTLSYRITIDYLNKSKSQVVLDEIENSLLVKEDELTTLDLDKYLQILNSRERLVLVLFLIEGYQHQEIADKLDLTEGNSKQIYRRALNKLKSLADKQAFSGLVEQQI